MRALTLQKGLTIAGFIILALLPLILDAYQLRLMITFFGFGIALLGFNLLFAYTGLLSFGHALYLALGAYTAAFCTSHFEIYHMEFILLTAIVVAAVVAMITGALCVRYVEVYFAMLTFAFAMLFYTALLKSYHLTGGDEGMPVERPYLLGMDLSEVGYLEFLTGPYYYYALALLILATVIMWRLVRSHFGLSLQAIRENPEKAAFLGIPVHRYQLVRLCHCRDVWRGWRCSHGPCRWPSGCRTGLLDRVRHHCVYGPPGRVCQFSRRVDWGTCLHSFARCGAIAHAVLALYLWRHFGAHRGDCPHRFDGADWHLGTPSHSPVDIG